MNIEKLVGALARKVEEPCYGKHRGIVVENADPERLGRLKLKVPGVFGDRVLTGWAYPCVPYGGAANQGFLFIPEVGAEVWVEFEAGNTDLPLWVGTVWSKPGGNSELPKANKADGTEESAVQNPPTCKIIKTRKGHTIQFEDKDGGEMIRIVEATHKHVITLNQEGITITDGMNKHKVVLNDQGIEITDGKNEGNELVMKNGEVTVKTNGTLALESDSVLVGNRADQMFVLGNSFAQNVMGFLNTLSTHTHVGNLGAPTSPPSAAFQLTVPLSEKHKVE